jgi:hypothetical protein
MSETAHLGRLKLAASEPEVTEIDNYRRKASPRPKEPALAQAAPHPAPGLPGDALYPVQRPESPLTAPVPDGDGPPYQQVGRRDGVGRFPAVAVEDVSLGCAPLAPVDHDAAARPDEGPHLAKPGAIPGHHPHLGRRDDRRSHRLTLHG